jgi:hypothetical protein
MQTISIILIVLILLFSPPLLLRTTAQTNQPVVIPMNLDAVKKYQTVAGFGANLNPDQWEHGNLKRAFDLLVDDLGGTLFRFDCFGTADWFDPARKDAAGHFPESYQKEVYTSKVYKNAWEALRYLSAKPVRIFLNTSGRIPAGMAGADGQTLRDYEGYAEMVVSQLRWAREKENIKIHLLSPFNETDLGFPEGPIIRPEQCREATRAIVKKLEESGMGEVKLILMDESGRWAVEYPEQLAQEPSLAGWMEALALHTYGNGNEGDGGNWYRDPSSFSRIFNAIQRTSFHGIPLWLTEYGDLDQSRLIEYAVGWRSTRRLLKALQDGVSAGLVWDGYDNYHKHDDSWSLYGLLETVRKTWSYTPKPRYYAARQVYRFVRPGWQRIDFQYADPDSKNVYAEHKSPMKHQLALAFLSPDESDCTIVGMSGIENNSEMSISLKGLQSATQSKTWTLCQTSRTENCLKAGDFKASGSSLRIPLKENSIFSLTTLK